MLAPVLFMATQSAGRSGVMGAGLVASLVMLGGHNFAKVTSYGGILASVFLMIGEYSVGLVHSNLIAVLIGIGDVLLTIWVVLVAGRLLQQGQRSHGPAK